MKKDIEQGIKQGRFTDMPAAIGVNIIFSTLKSTIQEILSGNFPRDAQIHYENQAIYQMLLGLGVEAKSALEISQMPLSELPQLPKKGIAGKVLRLIAGNH
jgi:hypothetical protein